MSIRIPESLHRGIKELATKDGYSMNQFIISAAAEKLSSLATVDYLRDRAANADLAEFDRILELIPDSEPDEVDRLPQSRDQQEAYSSHRRSLIGSGDRSEKIRTYNFPQSRITDHRIGFTSHNLTGVIAGDLTEFTNQLQKTEMDERLAEAGL